MSPLQPNSASSGTVASVLTAFVVLPLQQSPPSVLGSWCIACHLMRLQADKCEQLSRLQLRMDQVRGIPLNLCQSRVGLHSTAGKAQSLREEKDIRVARI